MKMNGKYPAVAGFFVCVNEGIFPRGLADYTDNEIKYAHGILKKELSKIALNATISREILYKHPES